MNIFHKIQNYFIVIKLNNDIKKLEKKIIDIKTNIYNVSSTRLNIEHYRNKTKLSNLEFEIAEKKELIKRYK